MKLVIADASFIGIKSIITGENLLSSLSPVIILTVNFNYCLVSV